MRKNSGFTLIEILVVMVIFAIMTSVVLFSLNKSVANDIERFKLTFSHKFHNIVDLSVATQKQFALRFYKTHIILLELVNQKWQISQKKNNFEQFGDKLPIKQKQKMVNNLQNKIIKKQKSTNNIWLKFPEDTTFTLYVNNNLVVFNETKNTLHNNRQKIILKPHVIIASSLEVSPFELKLFANKIVYTFKVNQFGELIYETTK